jgi:hypothetical protein
MRHSSKNVGLSFWPRAEVFEYSVYARAAINKKMFIAMRTSLYLNHEDFVLCVNTASVRHGIDAFICGHFLLNAKMTFGGDPLF